MTSTFEVYKHNSNTYEIEHQGKIITYTSTKKEAYTKIKEYATENNVGSYFVTQLNFE